MTFLLLWGMGGDLWRIKNNAEIEAEWEGGSLSSKFKDLPWFGAKVNVQCRAQGLTQVKYYSMFMKNVLEHQLKTCYWETKGTKLREQDTLCSRLYYIHLLSLFGQSAATSFNGDGVFSCRMAASMLRVFTDIDAGQEAVYIFNSFLDFCKSQNKQQKSECTAGLFLSCKHAWSGVSASSPSVSAAVGKKRLSIKLNEESALIDHSSLGWKQIQFWFECLK